MDNWIDEISSLQISNISSALGLKIGRLSSYGPCPSCNAERRGSSDPRQPLGLTPNKLGFMCHKCKVTGDNLDLISLCVAGGKFRDLASNGKSQVRNFIGDQGWIRRSSGGVRTQHISSVHRSLQQPPTAPVVKKEYKGIFKWSSDLPELYKRNLYSDEGKPVLKYLHDQRMIDKSVLLDAGIGCVWEGEGSNRTYWLSIPLRNEKGVAINMKFRSVPPAKKSYRHCPERPLPLFGADTLDTSNETIIVCEGEFDVLAMKTYGFGNCITAPAGAGANWKDDWLDTIERYKSFVLLFDDDKAGNEGAEKLAEKLGKYRCFRAMLDGYNDPNEALMAGAGAEFIETELANITSYIDPKLSRVDEFRDELEELILNPHKTKGATTGSAVVDNCVGGIRAGLWVITGDTGAGKSTWINWLCYEQALRDTPVMMTSFENSPIATVQKLLRMHLGGDFTKFSQQERSGALQDLGNMPIYLMNHYGEIDREKVIESVRYSARRHDVKIALIDHLGFLTTPKNQGEDERLLIESTVRALCQIAIQDKITIILICHPNNTSVYQNRRVKITDLKGASAIRQDAHVGVVVERKDGVNPPTTILHFDKVRSEFGRAGSSCQMAFDPLACIYADTWEQTPAGRQGKQAIVPTIEKENKR